MFFESIISVGGGSNAITIAPLHDFVLLENDGRKYTYALIIMRFCEKPSMLDALHVSARPIKAKTTLQYFTVFITNINIRTQKNLNCDYH